MEQREETRKRVREPMRNDMKAKGNGKLLYHTKEDLPTKEEMMENFKLDKIDKAYEEKWDQIEGKRKNKKKAKRKGQKQIN